MIKCTERTLNIFTDCSTTDNTSGTATISSGYLLLKGKNTPLRVDNKIFTNSTSDYGEEYAIMLGLQAANKIYEMDHNAIDCVNVFSDSLNIVRMINHVCKKYFITDDMDFYETIKNDSYMIDDKIHYFELFEKLIRIANKFNTIPIRFYHVSGHVRYSVRHSISDMITKFKKFNNETISRELAIWICKNNTFIDTRTRDRLKETMNSRLFISENYKKPNEKPNAFLITPNEYMSYMLNLNY